MTSSTFVPFSSQTFSSSPRPPTNTSQQHFYATANNNIDSTHSNIAHFNATAYNDALAFLQQHSAVHPTINTPTAHPNVTIQHPTPVPATHRHLAATDRHDSAISNAGVDTHDWQAPMYQTQAYNSMGGPVVGHNKGVKRARVHQRTPSASTVASTGPASPYMQNGSYPHIVGTDQSPNSPAFYADQALMPKNLPTPSQTPTDSGFANIAHMPSQAAHMPNAHLAMKDFGIGHHTSEDLIPDFAPSRQSMSSYGNDSPATPQSGAGDVDAKQYSIPPNGEIGADLAYDNPLFDYLLFDDADYRQSNPNVQLFRTESQAFQDELYNPNFVNTSAPSKQANAYLSPHRNLVTERLQTANLARSASPASAISRERSPFRDGSPLAPARDWRQQGGPVTTAAGMRQQQKDEAAEAEYAQHRATLQREPTKTISPKDAVLDYHEGDQPSLFQDSIPAGYEKHMGGTEQWPTNTYFSQPDNGFGNMATTGQQNMSFRTATADGYSGAGFDFSGLPQSTDQIQSNPFQANYQAAVQAKMNNFVEPTPNFNPPSMPSMETSISDAGFPHSSQDSGARATPQRPDDTRANTGTYTCTYHGCTQRFGSHNDLQKHKRDYHRSQQQTREGTSTSGTESTSPRSTESPERTGGMTSAAILARNSQAGPHKCTRINPSTNKPCNTIFSRPYDLTRHEDTIHNNRKQKVRCPMCREEKTFSRNDALTRHMRVVHPEVETIGKRGRRSD